MLRKDLEAALRFYVTGRCSLERTIISLLDGYSISTWCLSNKTYEPVLFEITTILVDYKFHGVNKVVYKLHNLADDVDKWLEENKSKLR